MKADVRGEGSREESHQPSQSQERLIGSSPPMRELERMLELLGKSDTTVLIEGETGVGKNLVARTLHRMSPRARQPFVSFNAANLSQDLFESELFGHVRGAFSGAHQDHPGLARMADGGTLFLDEVGEMPIESQAKLLRFLDRKEVRPVGAVRATTVDLRLISATNRNLVTQVKNGEFRSDLYYRLRVLPLRVPSLRERREDVPLLARHFLERHSRRYGKDIPGISREAMEKLGEHLWEGNVRELENEIERAVVLTPAGQEVRPETLTLPLGLGSELAAPPPSVSQPGVLPFPSGGLKASRAAAERELVHHALVRHRWNVSAAARELGISRVGLTRKLKRLGLERPGSSAPAS